MNAIALTPLDLTLAASLLVANGIISVAFGLRLERHLAIAAIRMVVQLSVVGLVLRLVFEQASLAWTILVALAMVAVAGLEFLQRPGKSRRTWAIYGLGNVVLLFVGGLAALYAAAAVIGPSPWHDPRYLLPMLGMVLGTTLTSISLTLQTLSENAARERAAIDARLALGAPRLQAFSGAVRTALRTAITPLLNTMAAAGVVTLPGMMAGQIVAGTDPGEAARYQIMVLFVLAGASGLGACAAAVGSVYLMTDRRHRLRLDSPATGNT